MGLFGTKSKKESEKTCSCGGACDAQTAGAARILVLGACCKTSADTFANVQKAAAELGLTEPVVNTGDMVEIAKYGVMQTPALVLDGKVVSYGRLIQVAEAKKLLEQAGFLS